MTDFNSMSPIQIKNWLIDNRVCIVTNSTMMPGCLYLASLKTYIDYLPQNNFWTINGTKDNGDPFYGVEAFHKMICTLCSNKKYKYVIYIDEDCFIKDFRALLVQFEKFKDGNKYCIAGPQDGGVICHRNHSALLVNGFLTFWNISLIRPVLNTYIEYIKLIQADPESTYEAFKNLLITHEDLYTDIIEKTNNSIRSLALYRLSKFNNVEPPYCKTVRDDPTNDTERYQTPYTSDSNIAIKNFEPYYIVEEAIILATLKPIMYLHVSDLFDPTNETKLDNSGLTSVVLNGDEPFAYHTWFSRAYNVYGNTDLEIFHTNRINKIIKNI